MLHEEERKYLDFSKLTFSDLLDICVRCENEEDAQLVLSQFENVCKSSDIARKNLGYLFGYLNEKDRKHVYKLFPVNHPIFRCDFGRK